MLFEQTKGFDIVLPLLAAAGTGPIVVDYARSRAALSTSSRGMQRVEVDESEPFVVLPDSCEVDNRITVCLEDEPLE